MLARVAPDEVYNLGAQSHVRVSFDIPEYTVDVAGVGTLRLLEAIRNLGMSPRFYQASSSEMFGKVRETPQTERTPFHPRSPYACRQGVRAPDHGELPRELRPARVVRHPVQPREPAARRELRHAQDHARPDADQTRAAAEAVPREPRRAARLGLCRRTTSRRCGCMLQQEAPDDYVIATGETHSVREFLDAVGAVLDLDWTPYVDVDPRYYRPAEVDILPGRRQQGAGACSAGRRRRRSRTSCG